MKKLLFILMTLLSFGANAQSITEVIYPQYVQGVGSSNASDDRKVPYACRMTVSGLTASATYRFYPRFVADPLLATNGQGNMIFANQTGNFIRTTSPSLAVAGRYGEFTTDATGSYTGWFVVEPSLALEYQPGTTLYFRLMLNNGAGGGSVATRITATNSVTVLGWGSGASQGTGLRASANTAYTPKNFMFFYNNITGTGRPLSGTFIENDGTDNNATTSGYAPFYANSVDNVNNTWGTIIPNNLTNGVNYIAQYSLSTGNAVNYCSAANGLYGSTNTANANGGLNELVLSCTPIAAGPTCNVTATISGTNVLCNGASTGAANLTVTGATAPVTYVWSNSATTEDLTGIPAGTYSVTVTDANNCTATANVTITQNTALVAASTVGAAILCANGTTTVTVTATGGTAPYTGTGTFTAPAGAYSYTVTDANGCTSVTTGTVNGPAALVASATFAPIACNGGTTSVTVSATGGTAPYTGTGTFVRSAGAYSFTVTDANGCTSVASGTISQPTLLVASFTIAPIPCDGSNTTVTVSATGGTAPYTGTGTFSRAAGSFSYTVTDANGCTKVVTGIVNRVLASSASAGVIACGQTTTTVTVSASEGTPPYTGTGSFTVGAGAYSYTVTDANGCTSVSSGTVAPPVCLTLTGVHYPQFVQGVGSSNAADDRKVPYAARMTVGGLNPSTTYRYYPRFVADPASTGNGQGNYILANQSGNFTRITSATLATAGRYGEFTTDATGSFTGWFVVEPSLALEFQPGTTLYLRLMINNGAGGGSVAARITATESVTVLGWGSASNQGTGLRSSAVPAYTAKNFVMLYNNVAGTGRPLSGTFIESDGTDNNATTSGYAPFYANNVDGVDKTWGTIIPNNLSNGINNISQFALSDGSFINKCTAANGVYGSTNTANANGGLTELVMACSPLGNCAVTASIAGTNVLCNGASTGAANLTVTGATAPVTYAWSNSAITEDLTGILAGTYSVTVTDANNCTATANVTITQPTALVAASSVTGAAILCANGTTTVTVTATGGTAPYTGTGTFTRGAGAYSYTVTDANGCTSVTTGNITQPAALVAASTVGAAILCNGGTTTVTVSATGGTAPYTGTGTFTTGAGAYSYTVTDANGCTSVTTGNITQPTALVAASSVTGAAILCANGTTT
ncbi:MAG: SprB repeat-containing protein, partial [Sphingobacteriales bacterium]|nr:SprB repeat-containing protein [Sphingobacteriales bacterium]